MGGHDHGHHHNECVVPDYTIYKVEDVPQLVKTQKALAALGLRDPWLRNEVWRYNPEEFGTTGSRFRMLFFRGFRTGVVALAVTLLGTALYDRAFPSEHGHDHGHDHH